jgi:hypothetical protein
MNSKSRKNKKGHIGWLSQGQPGQEDTDKKGHAEFSLYDKQPEDSKHCDITVRAGQEKSSRNFYFSSHVILLNNDIEKETYCGRNSTKIH